MFKYKDRIENKKYINRIKKYIYKIKNIILKEQKKL